MLHMPSVFGQLLCVLHVPDRGRRGRTPDHVTRSAFRHDPGRLVVLAEAFGCGLAALTLGRDVGATGIDLARVGRREGG